MNESIQWLYKSKMITLTLGMIGATLTASSMWKIFDVPAWIGISVLTISMGSAIVHDVFYIDIKEGEKK